MALIKAPILLSGGNPQIPKGAGDAPVQAYISCMPGWKSGLGQRLDQLIVDCVPNVQKAVKWNTPLYGLDGVTWFIGMHCFAKFVRVTFFRGLSLTPVPPVASKVKDTRYWDVFEDPGLNEAQFTDWVRQAHQLPGEKM
jgi:hypothetical protein